MRDAGLVQRIGVAVRELRRGSAQDLRSQLYGELVDLAQADALAVVAHRGKCMMSDLAAELRVDASAATRTVRRLTDAGLLSRATSPADARAVVVSLTPAGEELVHELSRRGLGAFAAILEEFTREEMEQLAELLERFVRGIDRARMSANGGELAAGGGPRSSVGS